MRCSQHRLAIIKMNACVRRSGSHASLLNVVPMLTAASDVSGPNHLACQATLNTMHNSLDLPLSRYARRAAAQGALGCDLAGTLRGRCQLTSSCARARLLCSEKVNAFCVLLLTLLFTLQYHVLSSRSIGGLQGLSVLPPVHHSEG